MHALKLVSCRFDNFYAWESTDTINRQIMILRDFSVSQPLGTLSSSNLRVYLQSGNGIELKNTVRDMLPAYIEILRKYFGTDFEDKEL